MTKQEYFEQLLDCLPAISPEEQQQIYEYYNELICDGIEEGKTEEEMLLQFGDPDALAAQMQEEWELSRLSCDGTDCCYTSEKPFNLIDFFIQEYNFSVTPSSDETLHIYFPKEVEKFVRITENNEELYFSFKPVKQNPFSFFLRNFKTGTIRLEIPAKKVQALHTSARNGSISIQNVALDETILSTTNAYIRAGSLVTKHLELTTKNAPIHLEDAIYTNAYLKSSNSSINLLAANGGSLKGETSNSKIHATKVSASNLELTTSNSSIFIEDCVAPSVALYTSNAKIKVEALRSNDISLTTSNASIHGNILGNEQDYSIVCGTSNGKCEPQTCLRTNAPGKLSAHSSNGSIQISFLN